MCIRPSFAYVLPLLVLSIAQAQGFDDYYWEADAPIYGFSRDYLDWGLGYQVCNLGDVDQDGVDDLLISIPLSHRGRRYGGATRVISLATGTPLYTVLGSLPDQRFGQGIGAGGDVDGDGIQDWLASDAQRSIYLHSGANGARLSTWTNLPSFPNDVAILGDVDGDGTNDVLVGMSVDITANGDSGSVHVLSGLDGSLIRRHIGEVSGAHFGERVLLIGDRDGDGHEDYAVAAGNSSTYTHGLVTVFSGATGQVAYTLAPSDPEARRFGVSMDLADDLDGDGIRDLFVLDPQAFFGNLGKLYAYSSATGALLYSVNGSTDGYQLRVAGNLGDLNGDGVGESIVLIRYSYHQGVEIRSGADGGLLRRYHGPSNYEGFGSVTGVGDVDADGSPDFASSNHVRQTVVVASTAPRTPLPLCEGQVNSRGLRAELEFSRSNSIGRNRLRFNIRKASRHMLSVLFYGPGRTHVTLGQGTLCVGGPHYRMAQQVLNHSGETWQFIDLTSTGLPGGQGAILAGSTWAFQAWYRDGDGPGAFNLTGAVSVPFRP